MKIGSLCSGIGGLELGLEAHGMTTVWHAEIDEAASSVLARHWPGVPNHGSIKRDDWSDVEPVDLICGGYPCQPFSHAGKRRGEDDPRHLWPHVAHALRVLRPRYAVLENVGGHLSLGFDTVLCDLAEAGFDAWWTTVRASDLGAPHRRERLFIVATDTGHGADDRQRTRPEPRQGGPTPADTEDERHERRGRARRRGTGPTDGGITATDAEGDAWWQRDGDGEDAADTDSGRLEVGSQLDSQPLEVAADGRSRRGHPDGLGDVAWGPYEPAVRRWEHLTRPAPRPVDDRGRLDPPFVEWMMGYQEGWASWLPRTAALRCFGNAVVPQVSALAWSLFLADNEREAAA